MHEAGHPKPVLWNNPKGQGGESGRGVQDGGTHVYLWPIHVDVRQKPSQYCRVIIFQLKKKEKSVTGGQAQEPEAGPARRPELGAMQPRAALSRSDHTHCAGCP